MPDLNLPQPPPGVRPTPPSQEALESRENLKLLLICGLGSIVALAILLFFARGRYRDHPRGYVDAVNNARQLGLALFEFDLDFGRYPDQSTITAVKRDTATTLTLGSGTSNELFVQLLVAKETLTERIFYAPSRASRKPDDDFSTDLSALGSGECGFAYISNRSSIDPPDTPLAFGPVVPGTRVLDTASTEGKAVVLLIDNSVKTYPIGSSGRVTIHGMDLLDPRQPFWHGKPPDVKWPK